MTKTEALAILARTSEGLWSVARNVTNSSTEITMRKRCEELDAARAYLATLQEPTLEVR